MGDARSFCAFVIVAECSFGEREQEGVIGEILAFDWCGGGLAEKPTKAHSYSFNSMYSLSLVKCTDKISHFTDLTINNLYYYT